MQVGYDTFSKLHAVLFCIFVIIVLNYSVCFCRFSR